MVKRYRRRRTFKRKRRRISNAVKRYVSSKLKRSLETKHVSNSSSSTAVPNVQIDTQITDIPQGTQETRRVGNLVRVTGFYGRFQMVGTDATNIIRIIMYIPKDPTATITGANTYGLLDPDIATVLYDKVHTTTLNGPNTKVFTIAKKFRGAGLPVQFNSSTTTDVLKNNIKMLFVSDSGAVSHPTLSYHWILYFKDG